MEKLVGLYSSADVLVNHLDYIDALRKDIGLTHVIMGGDFQLPPAVWAKNPMPPGSEEFAPNRGQEDDASLRQGLENAHDRDLKVWICAGGWQGDARRFPEMCMQDMHGQPLSQVTQLRYAREQPALAYCPSDERMNEWLRAVLSEVARSYEVDGFDLTHFRYTAPAFLHNLFGCACPRCAQRAGEMGHNFEKMRKAGLAFWEGIQSLDAREVREAADRGVGLLGLCEWLGIGSGLCEWFEFRAGVIAANMKRFSESAHEAAGREIAFSCDTFPPSFALLVGHRYRDFMQWADYTSPLLPHVEVFILSTFASYADLLCQWIEGLEEQEALRFIYGLFGYDRVKNLPQSLAEFRYEDLGMPDCEAKCPALCDIVELELQRARLFNTGEIPSYPVIKGATWAPEIVRRLVQAAERMGHEGIIFQGTSSLVDYPEPNR